MGNEELLGKDDNSEEEEEKTLKFWGLQLQSCGHEYFLRLEGKNKQRWRIQLMNWGSSSWSSLNKDL